MLALAASSLVVYREVQYLNQQSQARYLLSNWGNSVFLPKGSSGFYWVDYQRNRDCKKVSRREHQFRVEVSWFDSSRPKVVEMEPINDSEHLDQILQDAQDLSQPVLIHWMASWCRKCIHLKPKLEKLAAEYDTKMKFYYVDVNKVPQALVKRGNIANIADAIDLLPRFTTRIDVNIKHRRISDFEFTLECAIFDLLDIPLYHGWIVDPQDKDTAEALGSKSYNAIMEQLVALETRSMKTERKNNPEEDTVDFAAATTATLGVPSPCL